MNFASVFHVVWPYMLQLGAAAFAVFLGRHVKNASDAARAQAIAQIAKDVATAVYNNNPKLTYLELVKQVVEALVATTGLPTANRSVIERVAASAVSALINK